MRMGSAQLRKPSLRIHHSRRTEKGSDSVDEESHRGTAKGEIIRGGLSNRQVGFDDAESHRFDEHQKSRGCKMDCNRGRIARKRNGKAYRLLYFASTVIPEYETLLCSNGASMFFSYFTGTKWKNCLDNSTIQAPSHIADREKRSWVPIRKLQGGEREWFEGLED